MTEQREREQGLQKPGNALSVSIAAGRKEATQVVSDREGRMGPEDTLPARDQQEQEHAHGPGVDGTGVIRRGQGGSGRAHGGGGYAGDPRCGGGFLTREQLRAPAARSGCGISVNAPAARKGSTPTWEHYERTMSAL